MSKEKIKTPPTNNNVEPEEHNVPPPPLLARQLVRYILGFGVSVAIGLAPYLGKLKIPGFSSLLELIPNSLHDTILPLSAALMGLVAVVIQWYGGEKLSNQWLRKAFNITLLLTIVSFIVLFVVHVFVVIKISYDGGSETFLIGFIRPEKSPCDANLPSYEECISKRCDTSMSDDECIGHIGIKNEIVQSYWGSFQIRIATLALLIPYLAFTGSFGILVGLLLLKERLLENLQKQKKTKRTGV